MPDKRERHGIIRKSATLRCAPFDERLVGDGTINYRRVVLGQGQ